MGTRIRYDTFFSNRPNPSGFLAMRRFLISVLLLGLLAGCSDFRFGPHRIDVQQGNALDQDNVARLKLGLNHSQVRFLLGTPLLVDPFHNDRWDYVYVYYKAGKLAEQKRISLFFDGDTLVRIEGDVPAAESVAQAAVPTPAGKPESQAQTPAAPVAAEASRNRAPEAEAAPATAAKPAPAVAAAGAEANVAPAATPRPEPVAAPAATKSSSAVAAPAAAAKPAPTAVASVASAKALPAAAPTVGPSTGPAAVAAKPPASPNRRTISAATSIVQPLPSPKDAPPYKDPHAAPEMSLQPETDVEQIKPDVIPPFPEPAPMAASVPASVNEDAVLKALNAWASAWSRRDEAAYLAAYAPDFIPQDGGNHADWEKRRRMLLEVARNIEVKIESPSVDRADDGTVVVTFNQFYRSDSYHDAVVKQLRMSERDGRWLIVSEKVLSVLHGTKP
jgi:outer membrane protein assembly factor BamE